MRRPQPVLPLLPRRLQLTPFSGRWHYIITGPENTPYHDGQYWGTLVFPANYPFAPPAIRMYTPSGRFQPSTRLCLSISDFHPKSFNPAWSVSTILIGLLSFMTSEEITTGSVLGSEAERRFHAAQSRWWNTTGGGSHARANVATRGNLKAGDGGAKFKMEWPDVDDENWKWLKDNRIDVATGQRQPNTTAATGSGTGSGCGPQLGLGDAAGGSGAQARGVMDAVAHQRQNAGGQMGANWLLIAGGVIFIYVMVARLLGGQ